MRHRPLATAAAAALLIGAVAGPAAARGTAASAAQPAAGTSTSSLNLLSLALAAHRLEVGGVALSNDTVSGTPASKVVVTPIKVDGTAYGEQTVTPASSPATVPVVDSSTVVPAALAGLAAVKSPAFDVSASDSDGASSKVGAASLGSVSVLGIPLSLNGTVDVSSLVNGTNAVGAKTVTVKNLALPSVADLLAALGLNLNALPLTTLTDLLKGLNLTSTAVTTAQQALDTAEAALKTQIDAAQKAVDDQQAKVDAAKADLATKLKALDAAKVDLTSAQAAVTAAQTAFDSATAAQATAKTQLDAATAAVLAAAPLGTTLDAALLLLAGQPVVTTYNAALSTYNSATALVTSTGTALANAKTVADAAQVAVNTAQAAVDAAQKLVTDLTAVLTSLLDALKAILANVQPQIDALLAAITAVLDGTPLVSIDSISIRTQALVTSAKTGGQSAEVVGGELVGLKVLGTDVLKNVLGTSTVNVLDLVGSTLTQVTGVINGLTGTLSSVLSNVPSLPSLSIPAPQIGVLTKSTSTDVVGGFGVAVDRLQALTITIPAITLPAAVALPNAASLPAISGLPTTGTLRTAAVGDLVSKPITLTLVTVSEQSKFHPAVAAGPETTPTTPTTPTTAPGTPNLATTGLPAGIALFAILLVAGALVLRRRLVDGTEV